MTAPRIVAAALVALAAGAQDAAALAFSRADINNDGIVELWEATESFPGLLPVQFRKNDTNRDGVIDRGEYPLLDNFYWLMFKSDDMGD